MFADNLKYTLNFTLLMCLLLFLSAGTFFNDELGKNLVHYVLICGAMTLLIKDHLRKLYLILYALSVLFFILLFSPESKAFLWAEFLVLGLLFLIEKEAKYIVPWVILISSFLIHLFYIQQTDIDMRQHDLSGIIYYINILREEGLSFNPWNMYYLFHQPLHFILCCFIFMGGLELWGSNSLAYEGLQYLSLFYVSGFCLFTYAILQSLKIREKLSYAILLLISFNPTLILFSGYISDDAAVLFWISFTTYFFIRWYQQEKLRDIILAAVGFGLGTLTKLSILMTIPAFGILFLYKLYTKRCIKQIWIGFFTFIIIAVPLSLCWILRNHILFDMQFFNIPDTSPNGQNFYNIGLWERLTDFSMLLHPFINAPQIVDENIWLSLIKTELFGEWDFSLKNPYLIYFAFILYMLNIILKLSVLGMLVFYMIKVLNSFQKGSVFMLFFAIQYIVTWLYSFRYAMDYPYVCSTDYRLFSQLILAEGLILALIIKKETGEKLILSVSMLYALLIFIIYYGLF